MPFRCHIDKLRRKRSVNIRISTFAQRIKVFVYSGNVISFDWSCKSRDRISIKNSVYISHCKRPDRIQCLLFRKSAKLYASDAGSVRDSEKSGSDDEADDEAESDSEEKAQADASEDASADSETDGAVEDGAEEENEDKVEDSKESKAKD